MRPDNRLPVHCRRLRSLRHRTVIPVATQMPLPPVCLLPCCNLLYIERTWLHHARETEMQMLELTTSAGTSIITSPGHMVAVRGRDLRACPVLPSSFPLSFPLFFWLFLVDFLPAPFPLLFQDLLAFLSVCLSFSMFVLGGGWAHQGQRLREGERERERERERL